jgi:hypothetical protein
MGTNAENVGRPPSAHYSRRSIEHIHAAGLLSPVQGDELVKIWIKFCLIATVISLLPTVAFAWGAAGHMLVSHVADDNLTSAARTQVQDLLGTQTMADVSSWADDERSRYRDQGGWHYIDWEITDGSLLKDSDTSGTVLDALSSQGKILADATQSAFDRKRALMYVIHFVGDMHQPLHTADNFDRGGNEVQVSIFGQTQNLHRAWDGTILNQVHTIRKP